MNKFKDYKINLGTQILKFLNGDITFLELENKMTPLDSNKFEEDELIKSIWHAIYQFDLDSSINDSEYITLIKNSMLSIANALKNQSTDLEEMVKVYFNNPK